jgi:sec-independent protein translocase protein TatA
LNRFCLTDKSKNKQEVIDMFGLGAPEIIVILVIALIIFGPGKLPELGKAIGKGIRDFKTSMNEPDEKKSDDAKLIKEENK